MSVTEALPTAPLSSERTPQPPTPTTYGFAPRPALIGAAALSAALAFLAVMGLMDITVTTAVSLPLLLAGALVVPGAPVVILMRLTGRALSLSAMVSISLSVSIIAAQTTVVLGWWNPSRTLLWLALGSLVACVVADRSVPAAHRTTPVRLAPRWWTRRRWLSLGALTLSTVAFFIAASDLDVLEADHFGLIGEIGIVYIVGLALLAWVIIDALRARRLDGVVLSAAVVVTIAYNSMLVGVATGHTSIPTAFVHRGFISVIAEAGSLPDGVDARFSWAGFFGMFAGIQDLAGLHDVTSLMVWAPLVFGILLSFGLFAIAVEITGRARLAWIAVLLYQAFNWYQQDYFAPQAVAMIGYTTVLAVMLWQLRRAPFPRPTGGARVSRFFRSMTRTPGRVSGHGPWRTLSIGAVLLVIISANTVSHQMTPILMVLALAAFAVTGTTRYRTLWLAAGLVFASWFFFGANDYWLGHLSSILGEIGQIGNSVEKGVSNRISGDPVYQQMQYVRMAASGGFALLAFAGWVLWRSKRAWWVGGLLCAMPFGLVVLQSYGGEMIIRVFLLASPVLAPFAALALAWLAPRIQRLPRLILVGSLTVALTIIGLMETTNRGLNTAFEASTKAEVVVTDEFISAIGPGKSIMTFSHAPHTVGIRRALDPTGPRLGFIDSYPCLNNISRCTQDREPDYIYITNQGLNMLALQHGRTLEMLAGDIEEILDGGEYIVSAETDSVLILRRTSAPALDLSHSVTQFGGTTEGEQ